MRQRVQSSLCLSFESDLNRMVVRKAECCWCLMKECPFQGAKKAVNYPLKESTERVERETWLLSIWESSCCKILSSFTRRETLLEEMISISVFVVNSCLMNYGWKSSSTSLSLMSSSSSGSFLIYLCISTLVSLQEIWELQAERVHTHYFALFLLKQNTVWLSRDTKNCKKEVRVKTTCKCWNRWQFERLGAAEKESPRKPSQVLQLLVKTQAYMQGHVPDYVHLIRSISRKELHMHLLPDYPDVLPWYIFTSSSKIDDDFCFAEVSCCFFLFYPRTALHCQPSDQ